MLIAQWLPGVTVPDFSLPPNCSPFSTEESAESFCVFWFDMEGNVVPGWKTVSAMTENKIKLLVERLVNVLKSVDSRE